MNPLADLANYGQAFWLDYIRRSFIESGELAGMIEQDGLRGVTSNPSIFEKAIAGSTDYAQELETFRGTAPTEARRIYDQMVSHDIRAAADVLRPVYERTAKADGYVSLEVSPSLARDTGRTIEEARQLWRAIDRPNLMVKVPATTEGLAAIEALLDEGINVNITLLFSVRMYENVAKAYIRAMERRAQRGEDLRSIASVASFFVSRIDTAVDRLLEDRLRSAAPEQHPGIQALLGKAAIANAKRAYARFRELFAGPSWEGLRAKGARPQRLLWASTSTKSPAYRDVLYVEELIGPNTVDTMPPNTASAFRDHGRLRNALEADLAGSERVLGEIEQLGISLDAVTDQLLREGVELFEAAFEKALDAIRKSISAPKQKTYRFHSGADLAAERERELASWQSAGKVKRLWDGDASLWTGADEGQFLGWLRITDDQLAHLGPLKKFGEDVKAEGFRDAVVLGMGGSSLAPEVLARTFGPQAGFPVLSILDSTDPAQIRDLEARLELPRTLFIVSSKSGSTLEPDLFHRYFFERMKAVVSHDAGRHFVAVTDPGSPLETAARDDGFRQIFHGVPSIGGRYSALSNFGMVPAAAMGLDVSRLLDRAEQMVQACASCVPASDNPGLTLGVFLGAAWRRASDKVTIIASGELADFGAWLEQLLAESTGKDGKGFIPVAAEPLGAPQAYGPDRVFTYLRFLPKPDPAQDAAIERLAAAGFPVAQIDVIDKYDVAQEFFRWEFATAVAGSVLGINPFNQPDVEASKVEARKLTAEFERTGSLPPERPFFEQDGIRLFADPSNERALEAGLTGARSLAGYLRAHLDGLRSGDYFGLLAYIERGIGYERLLEAIRQNVRDSTHDATCLGFGPRFLHSTGQVYKGGPNTGVFIQITCDDPEDLPAPGHSYTFGLVKTAQARGDFEVLASRGRRLLRVHFAMPVAKGLATLSKAMAEALSRPARQLSA